MFNFRNTIVVTAVILMAVLTGCDPVPSTGKSDKAAVVQCDYKNNKSFKKTTFKERRAKGVFYTCGGPYCKVTSNFKSYTDSNGERHSDIKTLNFVKYPGNFTIDKSAKNWSSIGCGTTYKKIK